VVSGNSGYTDDVSVMQTPSGAGFGTKN